MSWSLFAPYLVGTVVGSIFGAKVPMTIKYQPSGMKDKPRFPVYKGFRNRIDIGS